MTPAEMAQVISDQGDPRPEPPPLAALQRAAFDRHSEPERANIACLADVTPEKVTWLWPGRIPLGKITLLDGDPGLGKSTLTAELAAGVSVGRPMPGSDGSREPAGVIMVNVEDGLADTIAPRLKAAGADMTRIHALQGMGADSRSFALPEDLPALEKIIVEHSAKLVILDPLKALLSGDANAHKDQDVRRALAPLAQMADRSGAAILVVRHLNKNSGGQAIYRGGGSIGIVGAARSALLVAKDLDDPDARVLASVKSNLGPPPKSLRFSLVNAPDQGCAIIAWGDACDLTADALVAPPEVERRAYASARELAEDFLRTELANGPGPAKDVIDAAKVEGLTKRTVQRAFEAIGTRRKVGFTEGRGWGLREDANTPPNATSGLAPSDLAPSAEGIQAPISGASTEGANLEDANAESDREGAP